MANNSNSDDQRTPWTVDGSMPLPVCRNDAVRRADVVTMWNDWRNGLPADRPFRHSDGVAFLNKLNELESVAVSSSSPSALQAPQHKKEIDHDGSRADAEALGMGTDRRSCDDPLLRHEVATFALQAPPPQDWRYQDRKDGSFIEARRLNKQSVWAVWYADGSDGYLDDDDFEAFYKEVDRVSSVPAPPEGTR